MNHSSTAHARPVVLSNRNKRGESEGISWGHVSTGGGGALQGGFISEWAPALSPAVAERVGGCPCPRGEMEGGVVGLREAQFVEVGVTPLLRPQHRLPLPLLRPPGRGP